jgi:hypothetical protein
VSHVVEEVQLPPSWDGSVVLDIGGEIGALLLRTPPAMNGVEIDLIPEEENVPHTHSAVRERRLLGGVAYAAVYPSLKSGRYTVAGSGQTITIVGGQVTETEYQNW